MAKNEAQPTTADLHTRFVRLALEQAAVARTHGDVPFGAVVVKDGQVVIATPNREIIDIDITAHAETKAISLASRILGRRDLSDCTLYASNEPCLMCGTAVLYSCIPRVVYALSRDDLPHLFRPRAIRFEQLAKDTSRPPEIISGILREEALKLYEGINEPFRPIPQFPVPPTSPI